MIRQAYFYEGEDHIDDEYIKTIAKECAKCSCRFGCEHCTNCMYNPAQFVDFNRAKMLRTAFYIKNQERIGSHSKPSAGGHSEPSSGEVFFKFLTLCAGLSLFWQLRTALILLNILIERRRVPIISKFNLLKKVNQIHR